MTISLLNNTSNISLNIFSNGTNVSSQNTVTNLEIFTFLWIFISVVGILANSVVVIVLPTKKRSPTEYFCLNLAISDMLFLFVCPTLSLISLHKLIIYENLPLLLAKIICKADFFLTHLTVFITCLTLMSMAFDRFYAIMYPLSSLGKRSRSKAIIINISIWLISIVLSIPHGYFREIMEIEDSGMICTSSLIVDEEINLWFSIMTVDQLHILFTILIAYVIPFTAILFCYLLMMIKLIKRKKNLNDNTRHMSKKAYNRSRILIMIALVTILFGVTWLPIHCILLAMKFYDKFPYESDTLFVVKSIAHTLTYLNSMLNPFFYTIMSKSFKIKFVTRLSRYSFTHKSSIVKGNQMYRGSMFVKRVSQNEPSVRRNSSAYRYKFVNKMRET
ncbi:unnamed protein product [Brachionus calyciflorus]|uniref:G-protein coupled receptors family 1 profile domain-containing protein n=1 Tax=Brachionus calyciflorus TaxID=104777 RepID=A0A813R2R1_9BILA|nr:unnamed protein product [Brachionus calyciflorus]